MIFKLLGLGLLEAPLDFGKPPSVRWEVKSATCF